jgi:hypothetical protein
MSYRRPLEFPGFASRGFKMANICETNLSFNNFEGLESL